MEYMSVLKKKSVMENFIFCAVQLGEKISHLATKFSDILW